MKFEEICQLDERWQDVVAATGLSAIAAAGVDAAWDAHHQQPPEKVVHKQPSFKPRHVTVASASKRLYDKASSHLEKVLIATAAKAGMKGDELIQFLAQCAHETGNFTTLKERGSKQYFTQHYDINFNPTKAGVLGNTQPGDGARYHGRGYIQLTGRYNYALAGEHLDLPLEDHPELLDKPAIAAKVAVWFWNHRVKPRVNDFGDVRRSTKPINSGLAGLENRQSHFNRYKTLVASK